MQYFQFILAGSVQVVLQLLFIADVARRRVHLPEHDRSKPGRQVVTFLLICNVTMWVIYTFEAQKVIANPVQVCGWNHTSLDLCMIHGHCDHVIRRFSHSH